MLKNKVGLEFEKGERKFQFICDNDAAIGEIYDAILALRAHIYGIIQKAEEDQKEKPKEE